MSTTMEVLTVITAVGYVREWTFFNTIRAVTGAAAAAALIVAIT